MTQERLSDLEALNGISKTLTKMPLFLNLLLLKRESAHSSLVDIMTLTTLAEVSYVLYSVSGKLNAKL